MTDVAALLASPDVPESIYRVVVLGGGVAGLAAGMSYGRGAVVLEADATPGGLVRCQRVGDCWFDRVIHLLHFQDEPTQHLIRSFDDAYLKSCVPQAWVVTSAGTVRYPMQLHLGGLQPQVAIDCLRDFAQARFGDQQGSPAHYEDLLRRCFGTSMYELFFGPYNRKMWKRPLNCLAPTGFTWNISYPDFDEVARGLLAPQSQYQSYNTNGWYPRPPVDANLRGMEVLTRALSTRVADLRLGHVVRAVDPLKRRVLVETAAGWRRFGYEEACVTTLPLPVCVELCQGVPASVSAACRQLPWNRVWSVALFIEGRRPEGFGHWRYYPDETLSFTRLIYMNQFDPDVSPPGTWGLMAEIPEPDETVAGGADAVIARVIADLKGLELPGDNCRITASRAWTESPAYVVFTTSNQQAVDTASTWLREQGVLPLGRYGRWEYSSMANVIRDGVSLGASLKS